MISNYGLLYEIAILIPKFIEFHKNGNSPDLPSLDEVKLKLRVYYNYVGLAVKAFE